MACSTAPASEGRVVVITATPTANVEIEPTPTPHPTPRTWPIGDSVGDWNMYAWNDPDTDKEKIIAELLPRESAMGTASWLTVQCGFNESGFSEDDTAEVFVVLDHELDGAIRLVVQYRFDDGEVESESWPVGQNGTRLFSEFPTEFIWRIMHSQELEMRGERQSVVFDVAGLSEALFLHSDKCNWIQP